MRIRVAIILGTILLTAVAFPAPAHAVTITVKGEVTFQSTNKVGGPTGELGIHYAKIEIWDADTGADQRIVTTCTDGDGDFSKSVTSSESNGPDIYIVVTTPCSGRIELADGAGTPYQFTNQQAEESGCINSVQSNVTGGTVDLGSCDSPDNMDWLWTIHDYAEYAADLLDTVASPSTQPEVRMLSTHTRAEYHSPEKEIHIPWSTLYSDYAPDVIAHEYGHFVHDRVYNGDLLPLCPSEYTTNSDDTSNCAWREGWAHFYALRTFSGGRWADSDARYHDGEFANGSDLENNQPADDDGDSTRADNDFAVAGTLWDLIDSATDGFDDERVDYDFAAIYATFAEMSTSASLGAFKDRWTAAHSTKYFVRAAFQNKIDYDELQPTTTTSGPAGEWLRGTVTISAESTDSDSDPLHVAFYRSSDSSCSATLDTSMGTDASNPYSKTLNSAALPDAEDQSIWFCARGLSIDGTPGAFDPTHGYGIDNTNPAGTVTAPPIGGPGAYSVSWTSTDATSGVDHVDLYEKAPGSSSFVRLSSCSNLAAQDSCSRNPTTTGEYCYRVRIYDVAGNSAYSPDTALSCTQNTA